MAKQPTPPATTQLPFQRANLTQKISFRVTADEHALLQQMAAQRGLEVVDVIRDALTAYFTASPPTTTRGRGGKRS